MTMIKTTFIARLGENKGALTFISAHRNTRSVEYFQRDRLLSGSATCAFLH
jgi:hypothetical protein